MAKSSPRKIDKSARDTPDKLVADNRGKPKAGTRGKRKGLVERLADGPIICAEGYLFELERRGYVQAGAFVPEAVLDHPEVVAQVHRDFVHAGSDVVEAFTYYAHREKLRIIGREHQLEAMNRGALKIAKAVAGETVLIVDDEPSVRMLITEVLAELGWRSSTSRPPGARTGRPPPRRRASLHRSRCR